MDKTGMTMLGLNTVRGDVDAGENGLSALPGREAEARAAIDEAIAYAVETRTRAIHVMAGFSEGAEARASFIENLRYALAQSSTLTILIEPLNRHDAPGYFLHTTEQAREILMDIADPRLKLMFDCYHVGRTEGDVLTRLNTLLPLIGHIQFAGVPARGAPDQGELNYKAIFDHIAALGWNAPLGAEYKPGCATNDSLSWMASLRS